MGKSEAIGVLQDTVDYVKDLQKAIETYGVNGIDLYNSLDGYYNARPSLSRFQEACDWITDSNVLEVNEYLLVLYEFLENRGNRGGVFSEIYKTLLDYGVKCHAVKKQPTGDYSFLEDTPICRAVFFLAGLRKSLYRWNILKKPFVEMDSEKDKANKQNGDTYYNTTINNTTYNTTNNTTNNHTTTIGGGSPISGGGGDGGGREYTPELLELFNGHKDYIDKLAGMSDVEIAQKIMEWCKIKHKDGYLICQNPNNGKKSEYARELKNNRLIANSQEQFRKKLR